MRIPPPSYAATVWLVGPNLNVHFESPNSATGHTVTIPATPLGMTGLLRILREREMSGPSTIGHKSDPTQADLSAMLRAMATAPAREPRPVSKLSPAVLAKLRKVNA